ncbi:unnamed protein product [Peronospora belbahrii]|uniref:E2F/DP family winged-helix DNA-binding domain-containing protein n=1 Tax=Peronospora belbahrii TaxID=622444 RepID=A0ABN8CQF0_9STRA|nr:unnamed protein product [Peronospora belbahrii]
MCVGCSTSLKATGRNFKLKSMKAQRTHRRKLRFTSTKDTVPVVTVMVEQASKRPVKRRKRRQRSRRVSPTPAFGSSNRSANSLPEPTWCNIQERFIAAKSLGEITRIMLQFFKLYEDLQGSASDPAVFPIFIPSSEIYKMKVPRKRRIYDVLHVLEGIGVIKRVRCGETRRTKGGYFLYFGKAAVVQRLAEIKNVSAQARVKFRQSHCQKMTSMVEEDSTIVTIFEKQAAAEKWPCLVTTTVCFLGLLFQQDGLIGVTLPAVSSRLIEAKKFIGALESSPWIETPYSDVHRRVYDVMSVLVSCNMIGTAPGSSCDQTDKCFPRKYARFNYNIFTDPSVLFAAQDPRSQSARESTVDATETNLRDIRSPLPRALKNRLISPPLAYWQNVHAGTALIISPIFSSAVVQISDASSSEAENWEAFCYDENMGIAMQGSPATYVQPEHATECRPEYKPALRVQDLFSPLGKELTEKNDWYDEPLKQLGLYDAEQISWNASKKNEDSYCESWGSHYAVDIEPYAPVEAPGQQFQIDRVEVRLADLDCNDTLVEDVSSNSINFFC